jgi:hypothetical protein
MKNRPTLADLVGVDHIPQANPEELMLLWDELATENARLKRAGVVLLAACERRYRDDIKPGFGTQHIEDGEFDVRVEVSKRIEWDNDKLKLVPGEAQDYVRWKPDVLESKYKSAPDHIKAKLDEARTVKLGAPKFTITRRKEG